jgi:hypothetical protein
MDLAELERKLIAAARAESPSERVPYAFEKRVLARLATLPAMVDHWALWSRALWRAAAPCVAIMLLLGAWSLYVSTRTPAGGDLSQEFENTLIAAAEQEQPTDWAW